MSEEAEAAGYTAFAGEHLIASGDAARVALAMKAAAERGASRVVAFEDATGRQVDFDLRSSAADIRERLSSPAPEPHRQGRGRPKLGVVAREVTLLPRHWDWLAEQPGGASAALRRLVDQARRAGMEAHGVRQRQDAAYRVMSALAGDLPRFEEAARALFACDYGRVETLISDWPKDVTDYVLARVAAVQARGGADGK